MKTRALIFFFVIVFNSLAIGLTLQVPSQYNTIQRAIDSADNSDIIVVSPGTYIENINFHGKAITLTSTDPQNKSIVESTIIDGSQPADPNHASVVTFDSNEGRDSILQGFTLAGGNVVLGPTLSGDGGGIFCLNSSPIIENCIIKNNIVGFNGGGCYCLNSAPIFNNCIFFGNCSRYGGALCNENSNVIISNCIFENNLAYTDAGAVYQFDGSLILKNSIFIANTASDNGGALVFFDIKNNLKIDHCTFSKNVAFFRTGAIFAARDTLIDISNSIVWDNSDSLGQTEYSQIKYGAVCSITSNYNCIQGWTGLFGGTGNFAGDPLLQSDGYHLKVNSSCINTGDPNGYYDLLKDIDGLPRLAFGAVDIGADEFDLPGLVCDAGSDQSYSIIPPMVTLDAGKSKDISGNPLSYNWKQVSGPTVSLNNTFSVNPSFQPIENGIYVFELVVTNGSIHSDPDTVGIVIGNLPPVAVAGPSRYAGPEPIVLDGSASYDPDHFAALTYKWTQLSGPSASIFGADTPRPMITFTASSAIQSSVFKLVVSDGDLSSIPVTIKITIVPDYGANMFEMVGKLFDPNKPTIVAFGGGNCNTGSGMKYGDIWLQKVNCITAYYEKPYTKFGDMLIVFLSRFAPDYKQPIQTMGYSTGGMPAIDVANRINLTYKDPRYTINRISFHDAACRDYSNDILTFLSNPLGRQCWIDNYFSTNSKYYTGTLNLTFPGGSHSTPTNWFYNSQYPFFWPNNDMYNDGVSAGFFYSVAGPGKNLQLASNTSPYYFKWIKDTGFLTAYSSSYPGRLPEPVTLLGPADGSIIDSNGAVFTSQISRNSVNYKLMFGPDKYSMNYLLSDTANPPANIVRTFPFETTYWTIKAADAYGSTIFADPVCIKSSNIAAPIPNPVGKEYLTFIGYELVWQRTISDTISDYCFRLRVKNMGLYDITAMNLRIKSAPDNITILNDKVFFSLIPQDSNALSDDTFIITIDRNSPEDQNDLVWEVTDQMEGDFSGNHSLDFMDIKTLAENWLLDYSHPRNIRSLLAQWDFSDSDANTALDISGNNNHAVLYNGASFLNGAISLDGINDYLQTQADSNSLQLNGDYSISLKLNLSSLSPNNAGIITKSNDSTPVPAIHWSINLGSGTDVGKIFVYHSSSKWDTRITLSQIADSWHNIAVVYGDNFISSYLDGQLICVAPFSNLPGSGYGSFKIGADRYKRSFSKGLLDDIFIFNYQLTPYEIKQLHRIGSFIHQPVDTLCNVHPLGDLNSDCKVDYRDFAFFADKWLQAPGSANLQDPYYDQLTNPNFEALTEYWLKF